MLLQNLFCLFFGVIRIVYCYNLSVIQKDKLVKMEQIPTKIQTLYVDFLKKNGFSSEEIPFYVKWLRFYFDFCNKYDHEKTDQKSLNGFILKLRQKNQTDRQIKQAKQKPAQVIMNFLD